MLSFVTIPMIGDATGSVIRDLKLEPEPEREPGPEPELEPENSA